MTVNPHTCTLVDPLLCLHCLCCSSVILIFYNVIFELWNLLDSVFEALQLRCTCLFFCDNVTLFLRLLLVRYTCALPAHFPFSSYINIPNSSSEVDPKLDMYGIINVLYLKADKDMNGMISEPELADVYHGFDTNGQICLHLNSHDSGYVHGLFISRYLIRWCVRCAIVAIEISSEIHNVL